MSFTHPNPSSPPIFPQEVVTKTIYNSFILQKKKYTILSKRLIFIAISIYLIYLAKLMRGCQLRIGHSALGINHPSNGPSNI